MTTAHDVSETEPITRFKSPQVRSPYSGPWWDGLRDGKLVVQKCRPKRHISHPPGPVCKTCQSGDLEWVELSGTGEVYTATAVHRAMHPDFEPDLPYLLAYVRLDDGPQLATWLKDVELADVRPGMRVRAVFEKIDDRTTLHRFVPA